MEFVQQALEEFAKEHADLKLKKCVPFHVLLRRPSAHRAYHRPRRAKAQGPYKFVLAGKCLTLLCGDIFALPADGSFQRVWDRASLVALDPVQRQRYAERITAALAPRGVMLLQVLHRQAGPPLALQGGPPFSVSEADVKALYGRRVLRCMRLGARFETEAAPSVTVDSAFTIKKLESTDVLASNPRIKASGVTKVSQVTYLLTKKA